MPPMADLPSLDTRQRVTTLLDGLQAGEGHSSDELFTLVYADLRRLAAARMARLTPGQTLQATALVHEAYVCQPSRGSQVGLSCAKGW
jgi:hypothetical protein